MLFLYEINEGKRSFSLNEFMWLLAENVLNILDLMEKNISYSDSKDLDEETSSVDNIRKKYIISSWRMSLTKIFNDLKRCNNLKTEGIIILNDLTSLYGRVDAVLNWGVYPNMDSISMFKGKVGDLLFLLRILISENEMK